MFVDYFSLSRRVKLIRAISIEKCVAESALKECPVLVEIAYMDEEQRLDCVSW